MKSILKKISTSKEIFIEKIKIEYKDGVSFDYYDFNLWYDHKIKVQLLKASRVRVKDAREIYHSFQVFYYDFKKNNIETVTLISKYKRIFQDFNMEKLLSKAENIDSGNIFIVIDDKHLKRIKEIRKKILIYIREKKGNKGQLFLGINYNRIRDENYPSKAGIKCIVLN